MPEMKIRRKRSKPILVLLPLLLLISHVFAQTDERKITGKVTDVITGQPVTNASISVKGKRNAVTSDNDGVFVITVKTGETIEISSVGYGIQTLKIGAGIN